MHTLLFNVSSVDNILAGLEIWLHKSTYGTNAGGGVAALVAVNRQRRRKGTNIAEFIKNLILFPYTVYALSIFCVV